MCLCTNVSGHKRTCFDPDTIATTRLQHIRAQMCPGTNMCGHNRVWAQTCVGTIVSGHNRVWAQSCVGTIVWAQSCGHNRVGSSMYGHNRVVSITSDDHRIHSFDKNFLSCCIYEYTIEWSVFFFISSGNSLKSR